MNEEESGGGVPNYIKRDPVRQEALEVNRSAFIALKEKKQHEKVKAELLAEAAINQGNRLEMLPKPKTEEQIQRDNAAIAYEKKQIDHATYVELVNKIDKEAANKGWGNLVDSLAKPHTKADAA